MNAVAARAVAPDVDLTPPLIRGRHPRAAPRGRMAHDPVTGLPSRADFRQRLERALGGAAPAGTRIALLVVDVDRFTEVNVALGHDAGDALLRALARRLEDRGGPWTTVASLGADEFAVLLRGVAAWRAERSAAELVAAIAAPFTIEGQEVHVEASIGLAAFPDDAVEAEELLRHADVAMYAAKRNASGWSAYTPDLSRDLARPLTLLPDLRRGLARDELTLHYQPQVSLRTGAVVGLEALVRWRHPRRGLLLPADFVPLAERTSLMGVLSRWVTARALRDCPVCFPHTGPLRTAVNLSVRDLRDPDLPAAIATLLEQAGAPVRLSIEVTETAVMADAERVRATLLALRGLGVRLAIDDFGTGYSSLVYLKKLPVDELKIDRALVIGVADDATSRAIVKAVVDLGHSLGLEVIAEGVEDARTLEALRGLGCDTAQGHFISPPLERAALEQWVARSSAPRASKDVGSAA